MSFEATITSVHEMTPQVKQFVVERDEPFTFEPGQHTNVEFEQESPDDGEDAEVSRPYTATNTPGNDAITLAIKRYDDGTASVYVHDRESGDTITLADFHGELTLQDTDEDVVFVSTGTGITPMMAMVKQYLEEGTGEAHFLYGEKSQENLMYRETLDQLASEHENLSLTVSLSDEGWSGRTGHVQDHVEDVLDDLDRHFYVCGVPGMVVDTKDHLADLGVSEEQIFSEGWEDDEVAD